MRSLFLGAMSLMSMAGYAWAQADSSDAKIPPPVPMPTAVAPAADPSVVPAPSLNPAAPAAVPGANAIPADVRSRYRLVNGEWWFWTNNNGWKIWRNGAWMDFDPATYTPPDAGNQPAPATT